MPEGKETIKDRIRAADLIKSTAEATAKALVESTAQTLEQRLGRIQDSVDRLEANVKTITDRDDKFVLKEDFVFWRNILMSGMTGSIVTLIAIIMRLIGKQ